MNQFLIDNLKPRFENKKILLGITGSIAAFKAHDLIRLLKNCGAQVRVVATESALKFVTPVTLETLSGNPVHHSLWEGPNNNGTHHIDIARWGNIAVVAPASANFIAKLSHGFADDLLSTELLAFKGKLFVVPAMNPAMFENPATQDNLEILKKRGITILGPTTGSTACGEEGLGRMIEPDAILEQISTAFTQPQKNKKLLITIGPTQSSMDPVRFLTNHSSGKMGASLCWQALQLGYEVTAVTGPLQNDIALPNSKYCKIIAVKTASEMADAAFSNWSNHDVFIGAAAVLDWDFAKTESQKIKKNSSSPDVQFIKNPDILKEIGKTKKQDQIVLGFAAETENAVENAVLKLKEKNCDAIFANTVALPSDKNRNQFSGFISDQNSGCFITLNHKEEMPLQSKANLALQILTKLEKLK